jgi:hypothetical protein
MGHIRHIGHGFGDDRPHEIGRRRIYRREHGGLGLTAGDHCQRHYSRSQARQPNDKTIPASNGFSDEVFHQHCQGYNGQSQLVKTNYEPGISNAGGAEDGLKITQHCRGFLHNHEIP